jgi:integrase
MTDRINRLTARGAKNITKPGRHADGGNLYLNVTATGARSWIFLYRFGGKQREKGLGSATPGQVSLAKAREKAAVARQALAEGRDPLAIREPSKIPTFGEAADEYIEAKQPEWRNAKHAAQWRMTLQKYAAPLRPLSVDAITTEHVLGCLKPLWTKRPETASRLRGRIESILSAQIVQGNRVGPNPAAWRGHLDQLLPRRQVLSRGHHAAMPIDDVPGFIERLPSVPGISARCLEFAILTAARTGEAIGAKWGEIDFERRLWIVPAHRMKAQREHRIPLSDRALAILSEMAAARVGDFIFPGDRPRKPLSNMALSMVLRRMGIKDATTHGFRSAFRDWSAERTSFPHELAEMALAHAIESKTEKAYRRGDLLEKRRQLMTAWARFCASGSASGKVVSLRT